MRRILCGMDGGGTLTTVIACDQDGHIVATFTADTVNHYGVGPERVKNTYLEIKNRLVQETGRLPDAIYIGSSALDDQATAAEAAAITGGVFNDTLLAVHSDVYIALLGYTLGKSGAIVVSGTGSMACGIDRQGNYHTSGGWGHTLGDEGSGYHLGLAGIKAALRGADGIADTTALTQRLLRFYQLEKLTQLIDLVYNPPIDKSRIAAFAPEVEQAALQGDAVADRLMSEEAEWLRRLAIAIGAKCDTNRVGLHGGLVTKSRLMGERLPPLLKEAGLETGTPRYSPEKGALFGAFALLGMPVTEPILANLLP